MTIWEVSKTKRSATIFIIFFSILTLSLRVSFLLMGDFENAGDISNIVEKSIRRFKSLELFPSEKLAKLVGRSQDMRKVLLASRISGLRYVFILEKLKEGVVIKLLDVRSGEVTNMGKADMEALEKFLEREIENRFIHEDLKIKIVKIENWKEGRVYKKGDIVRYDGKLYRCKSAHYSFKDNEPEKSLFWEKIKKRYIAGYYASWTSSTKSFTPLDIDAEKMNLIFYAFANISDNGECVVGDPKIDLENFKELLKLKKRHPHLKILISIGGWNWSKNFSKVALSEKSRRKFAKSCINTFIRGSKLVPKGLFDGIDIDWEYPTGGGKYPGRPEDRENFTLLMKTLREELIKTGKNYLLTFAGAADEEYIFRKIDLKDVSKYVDLITIMTYDFKGWWDKVTGFQSELYPVNPGDMSVDSAVNSYIRAGAPSSKLLLGIPFYGRSWSGVSSDNSGLFQKAKGVGPGTKEAGILDYSDIVNRFEPKMKKYFHPIAQVPWLYGDGIFITYDDPHPVSLKALYSLEKDLAGVAIWELSCDLHGSSSLLESIYEVLKSTR